MQCPKCKSDNINSANFCAHCGHSLDRGKNGASGRWWLLCLALLVCAWAAYVFYGFIFLTPAPEKSASGPPIGLRKTAAVNTPKHSPEPKPAIKEKSRTGEHFEPGGSLTFTDKWGNERTIPCLVVSGYWLALPRRACLGAFSWIYTDATGNNYPVLGGIWVEGEDAGLWRLDSAGPLPSPALVAWNPGQPLAWQSLVSGSAAADIAITLRWEQGYWLNCRAELPRDEPGVFIQDNKIVGWSFAPWLEGGYLWNRQGRLPDDVEISVADFYQLTFGGGREEQFARGLALADTEPPLTRLATLAAAFRLPEKLTAEDTPPLLQRQVIIDYIYSLAEESRKRGLAGQLLSLFDPSLLRQIMDIDLLLLLVDIRLNSHNLTGADWLLTQAESWPWSDDDRQHLEEAELQLYLLQLADAVNENDPETGWQLWNEARTKFAAPEIELYGVELALLEEDWQTAEELLDRQWPTELADRVNELAEKIVALKRLENKIVIHFTPGARRIPVTALLNSSREQNFLIDTGATNVTIPLKTAEELGFDLSGQVPAHRVSTAGGGVMAWEIELEEIELAGWSLSGIKALVLDIPGQPDLGLLGLDFLNNFVVNIDSEAGVLLLEPK